MTIDTDKRPPFADSAEETENEHEAAVSRRTSILLLGTSGSAKSGLLAAMPKAVQVGVIGFPSSWSVSFAPDEGGWNAGGEDPPTAIKGVRELESRYLHYLLPGLDKHGVRGEIIAVDPKPYFGFDQVVIRLEISTRYGRAKRKLARSLSSLTRHLERKPQRRSSALEPPPVCEITIYDPHGSLTLEAVLDKLLSRLHGEDTRPASNEDTRLREASHQLHRVLDTVEHLVICKPIYERGACLEDTSWVELLAHVAAGRFKALKSVTLVFTCYEIMFLEDALSSNEPGAAVLAALNRERAVLEMSQALFGHEVLLSGLQDFALKSPVEMHCLPVSSFGFVMPKGTPNVDLWVRGSPTHPAAGYGAPRILVRPDIFLACKRAAAGWTSQEPLPAEIDRRLRDEWWPFLTADPFIACATGVRSQLMVRLDKLLQADHFVSQGAKLTTWA